MERRLRVPSTHTAPVSALAYQPVRREIITGHEDGRLKFWEGDTGQHVTTSSHHQGWITQLYYWVEGKVLFSCSVDGRVVQWSSTNQPFDSVTVGEPVFSLLWVARKSQLLVGAEKGLCMLKKSGKLAGNGHPLLSHRVAWLPGHCGIVRCLASAGSKVYSAGFDKRLVIHEVVSLSGDGDLPLKILHVNSAAHDAGITCLQMAKDADGSTWMMTGSFDKRVKVWTGDGKLVHTIQCSATVTGMCYVPQTRVLWIAAGSNQPAFYEPKSGDNVTEYVPVLDTTSSSNRDSAAVQLLKYIPETSEIVGSTKLKDLICWKYNTTCSVCCHQSPSDMHIETLTYTSKVPILIFSGSFNGEMMKWEQQQLNPFLYSQDTLGYKETLLKALDSDDQFPAASTPALTTAPSSSTSTSSRHTTGHNAQQTSSQIGHKPAAERKRSGDERGKGVGERKKDGGVGGEGKADEDSLKHEREEIMKAEHRGFVCSVFVECLDLLVASALDGNICVWGYDQHTVQVLQRMQQESISQTTPTSDSPTDNGQDAAEKESSSVISRVAGFTCLHVLRGHSGCVQALAAVETWTNGGTYLISGGWDLALCVWDLSTGRQVVSLLESLPSGYSPHPNLIITDIAYSTQRDEFAYATSDGVVYVRQFALISGDMSLLASLQGHYTEVTQVCWSGVSGQWVTGSADCTVRLWPGQRDGEDRGGEELCVSVGDPVSVLCVDHTTGCIVVGVQNTLKVYNKNLELLQVSRGHSDVIRSIIHIPDREQYVSASWDGSVRIWSAYH